ncbi:MAG: GntR family transcriptional regulator [Anaerolineales bacterium]|jgi:DNA-binding GntR family transcriptional regulator|nr:GntR family transcriptional regulator [Anaerolineales bacterium]
MAAKSFDEELSEIYQNQLQHRTVADAIYWTLRDAIRRGLLPPGSRLIENNIATALSISRTPVREAMRRLQSEQLLEKAPSRGLVVPMLTLDDLLDIYEIDEVLFGLIARKAAQHMSPSELELVEDYLLSIEQAIAEGDLEKVMVASSDFHNMIAYGCKNERLYTIYNQIDGSPRLRLFEHAPERTTDALEEHRALYEAIAARDGNQAEQIARQHVRNALRAQIKAQRMSAPGMEMLDSAPQN